MGYRAEYGTLLEEIAREADVIALRYFRAVELRVERKKDGTAVTQADRAVEKMARARVAASGLDLDVLGEEMGGDAAEPRPGARPRMILTRLTARRNFRAGFLHSGRCWGSSERAKLSRRWLARQLCNRAGKRTKGKARFARAANCRFRTLGG